MFFRCRSLTNLNIGNFDTAKVTDMFQMFRECDNLINLDLSNFDVSNVDDYREMFYNVPTTVRITTNETMKSWIETNFPDWAGNIILI